MAVPRSRSRSRSGSTSDPNPKPAPPRRPCSERKLEANRANAKKSTGPRTRAGKNRVRFNAVVHGATASLSILPGEDPATVKRFVERVYQDLRPRGQAEAVLVDQYASLSWKLRRLGAAERAIVRQRYLREVQEWHTDRDNIRWAKQHNIMDAEELDKESEVLSKEVPEPVAPGEMVADELFHGTGPLLRLIELETRLHGTMSNVLKQLKDFQALRVARDKYERADDADGDDADADDGWKPGEWDQDEERWYDDFVPEQGRDRRTAAAPAPPPPKGPKLRNKPTAAPAPQPEAQPPQNDAPPEDAPGASNGDGAAIDVPTETDKPTKATEDVEPPITSIHTDSEGEKPPSESV